MKELEYPFDSEYIITNRRKIRKALLNDGTTRIKKKIAILGGSTTANIRASLELFLLNYGIEPEFYESEYGKYYEDVMFQNPDLMEFQPDLIFIHTSNRNIADYPTLRDSKEEVDGKVESEFSRFITLWTKIDEAFKCPIIQNNFDAPFFRLLGNRDLYDYRGRLNFINRLNQKFSEYAETHKGFYINDINYLQADYGIKEWSDPEYYYMYKYILAVPAIPLFSYNVANIIKSIYGKNKKAFALDLDNTLWGGIVGDDGPENIEIGQETAKGETFAEFQEYLKAHKDLGILLTVDSKNEEENALAGLNRPDSVLHPDDFTEIKANWFPKSENLKALASDINIGEDAFVFVDDNPAEREIVRTQCDNAAVPELTTPEKYIETIDRAGYFEVTNFSEDDLKRNAMYKANAERKKSESSFTDYGEYLKSLDMEAEIKPFAPMYFDRIAQLTNKSNQFNLTTKRFSLDEIKSFAEDRKYVTLYGKLKDKFGDNGVVSVVFGHETTESLEIDLWLMSCRVLKRGMEDAMMDCLVEECKQRGIATVYGFYYPTKKNKMVKDFYSEMGFEKMSEDEEGNSKFVLNVAKYEKRNSYIKVN